MYERHRVDAALALAREESSAHNRDGSGGLKSFVYTVPESAPSALATSTAAGSVAQTTMAAPGGDLRAVRPSLSHTLSFISLCLSLSRLFRSLMGTEF